MSSAVKGNKMTYIHIAIMFAITFIVWNLPPFGQITEVGMKVLGVFLGIVYGWIFIDLLWTSFAGFALLTMTGYCSATQAFAAGFGNATFLMVLLPAAFAVALNQIGVSDGIAYWILSRKIFIGRPWVLILAICVTALLMGLFNGGMAAVFLMWTISLKIGEINGYKPGSRVLNMLIAFIVYIAMTAPAMVPFYGSVLLYGGFFTQATGLAIPTGPMMLCGQIYMIGAMLIMILVSKYVFKVDAKNFTTTPELCEEYGQYKMNKYQKVGFILLLFYFAVLMIPAIFPTLPGAAFCNSLGVIGWTIVYMTVFLIWHKEDGKPVIELMQCFNSLPWAMLMLLAVTYPLAEAMESADVGITATITATLTPILTKMDVTVLIIATMFAMGIITQFMHNIVMGAIFIPIITPIVISMGGNPYVCWFMMYVALMCAYVTPAGSMMAGMVFGHQTMKAKDAYIFGLLFLVVALFMMLIMMPLLNTMFVY